MKWEEFKFSFSHKDKTIPATCHVFKLVEQKEMPYKYPMWRIAINTHKIYPEVFLFYEVNEPDRRFFHYPFIENKDSIGQAISEALEKL